MAQRNAVGWFDIHVEDMARAATFYEAILEVRLIDMPDPTGETAMRAFPGTQDGYGSAGALVRSAHGRPGPGGTLLYFVVEECAATEGRVTAAGGTIVRPKFPIGEFGFVSLCMDTEGNMIGLNSMR